MEYVDLGDVCGCGKIIMQPYSGGRRKKCLDCSPRRDRDRRRAQAKAIASVTALPARDPHSPGLLTNASKVALQQAGMDGTWQAEAVLAVSRLIDGGSHGASGAAGNIRCHREAMAHALQSAPSQEADIVSLIFQET
jgi:hypothetical protein